MKSRAGLCDLPGEIQDKIILRLEPSAAIALLQTNKHFHAICSLHRLDKQAVRDFLEARKRPMLYMRNYLCSSCYHSKPLSHFLQTQVTRKRRKEGSEAHMRMCFECMRTRVTPGSIVNMGNEDQRKIVCMVCTQLRTRFCLQCRWCNYCVEKGETVTVRKNWVTAVPLVMYCGQHEWSGAPRAPKSSRRYEMDDWLCEDEVEDPRGSDWYGGGDD